MSCSQSASDQLKRWSTAEVQRWLITEVKVHQTCADKFAEEDVLGEFLFVYKKEDILDLGIKHGPAVKITRYLERLKKGLRAETQTQFPAYVEAWTKEQVCQWLLQHGKIPSTYAERLQEEDVSGDCLVCFGKQDFLDVGVRKGPAVNILDKLAELRDKPEPTLEPVHTSTEPTAAPEAFQPEPSPPQDIVTNRPSPREEKNIRDGPDEVRRPLKNVKDQTSIKQQRRKSKKKKSKSEKKKHVVTKAQPPSLQSSVKIQNILADLSKEDFKSFHFQLRNYKRDESEPIPWGRLEGKDTEDTATLMRGHYGDQQALQVTRIILDLIKQCDLARKLENTEALLRPPSTDAVRREANQGDKLRDLLTCGGNSLDNYEGFIVVVNKSSPEQVQHLQFLTNLKLFCVLDFDPNSAGPHGLCQSYKVSRVANLHYPSQYQDRMDSVIKNLNLYTQTSWVFCNGRNDLDSDSDKELDYKTWLKKSSGDVEQLVSFICNPDVLRRGSSLIVFLLLSPVETEKDAVFETYRSFYKYIEEKAIITICEPQSSYVKWRELILEKFEHDIDPQSVYELTLSEVNGTVMALRPFSQVSERLLPSTDCSAVVLSKKDEDLMTALDILCLNQCENAFDEDGQDFRDFRIKVEEEFYRGGKVKWWNFYFCDKDKEKPFVKRDKYNNVKTMIRFQQKENKSLCVLLDLFHHPGCGGTTLAMHVMWDLRKKFRCAVLKDTTLPKEEVAIQVLKLMLLESGKPSPVLLLADETENPSDLVNCIRKAVEDFSNINMEDTHNCKVIVLNCVRSHSPKQQYQEHFLPSQYITKSLTPEEQREFEKKLKDLQETHEKPENFYTFMIMKNNYDQKYLKDLARNTLESFDFSTKEAKLFAFLALLNTYVDESDISLSLCEDFFGMKMNLFQTEDSVLDRMKPYSNILIIDSVEDWGYYKGLRILHRTIADACLEELESSWGLKVSDITVQMLHYDLFFSDRVVKNKLMLSIERMLIKRQRKKEGEERELFSPLIDKIHSQQGRDAVEQIFVTASSRFTSRAHIPQALARYLYINGRDFPEALKWAEKAKKIKETPYTFDTIGQVYKSHLRSNIDREKEELSHNPEDLETNLRLATNGMRAFQRAQEQSDKEDEPQEGTADDDSGDYPRKSYNVDGYVRVLDIAFLVFEILNKLPFFEERVPMKKKYLQSFLKGNIPISSVSKEDTENNRRYVEIIEGHKRFLVELKPEVKRIFDFLDCYFTYIKGNFEFDRTHYRTVSAHFKKYVNFFCTTPEEMQKEKETNSNLKLKLDIEEHKMFLEKNQADNFSGILQHLLDKSSEEMEKILKSYAFLQQQVVKQKQNVKEKINYILSNIVLYLLNPKSKGVMSYKHLSDLLLEALQDVGLWYRFPDPYYLALLLFWPSPSNENTEIRKYVTAIRTSSRKHMSKLFYRRSTIAHLFLGIGEGLKRLVSKPNLDESFLPKMSRDTLAQLWWNGDIFKEKAIISRLHRVSGTIEEGEVFAKYGQLKILVRPALIPVIRSGFSTEKVSFYLGFAVNGPLAYDIKYEN